MSLVKTLIGVLKNINVAQLLKLLQLIGWYNKFVCKTSIYNKLYLIFIVDIYLLLCHLSWILKPRQFSLAGLTVRLHMLLLALPL